LDPGGDGDGQIPALNAGVTSIVPCDSEVEDLEAMDAGNEVNSELTSPTAFQGGFDQSESEAETAFEEDIEPETGMPHNLFPRRSPGFQRALSGNGYHWLGPLKRPKLAKSPCPLHALISHLEYEDRAGVPRSRDESRAAALEVIFPRGGTVDEDDGDQEEEGEFVKRISGVMVSLT
jgi:hypothetical protein